MVLSVNEKNDVVKSINTIISRVDNYFIDVIDTKKIGSYVRETILPRKDDPESDIDLMIIFNNKNKYKPQSFLNNLKGFVEHYYTRSEIYQSSPTIALELNHIKFELIPAYKEYGNYFIPKNQSEWQHTKPDDFHNDLIDCNKNNGYKIKPIIRLIKYWNIKKNYRDIPSFFIENKISRELKYSYCSCCSYTDYLTRAFEIIRYDTVYTRVDTALSHIKKSLEFERDKYPYSAIIEIKKIFPDD